MGREDKNKQWEKIKCKKLYYLKYFVKIKKKSENLAEKNFNN